ncbi:MAG: hypothetical protein AB8B74_02285 [Crocinitomicaceae bacterium]
MKTSVYFLLILLSLACQKRISYKTIGLQLLDEFTESELAVISDSLIHTFQCRVVVLPIKKAPDSHITRIKSFRYRADSLLNFLDQQKPDSIDVMLGLTKTDIAITKIDKETGLVKTPKSTYTDWAIFGLGRVNGYSCVVSNYRLKKRVSNSGYLTRFTRICNHEVGHVFGLRHCPTLNCLMNDANETIKTIDKSSGKLCDSCRSIIF